MKRAVLPLPPGCPAEVMSYKSSPVYLAMSYLISEIIYGFQMFLTTWTKILFNPIKAVKEYFDMLLHPYRTLKAIYNEIKRHPIGFIVNLLLNFLMGRFIEGIVNYSIENVHRGKCCVLPATRHFFEFTERKGAGGAAGISIMLQLFGGGCPCGGACTAAAGISALKSDDTKGKCCGEGCTTPSSNNDETEKKCCNKAKSCCKSGCDAEDLCFVKNANKALSSSTDEVAPQVSYASKSSANKNRDYFFEVSNSDVLKREDFSLADSMEKKEESCSVTTEKCALRLEPCAAKGVEKGCCGHGHGHGSDSVINADCDTKRGCKSACKIEEGVPVQPQERKSCNGEGVKKACCGSGHGSDLRASIEGRSCAGSNVEECNAMVNM